MFLLKLIWLFLLGVLVRRVYLGWKRISTHTRSSASKVQETPKQGDHDQGPLTDQDISDADFEEIP